MGDGGGGGVVVMATFVVPSCAVFGFGSGVALVVIAVVWTLLSANFL